MMQTTLALSVSQPTSFDPVKALQFLAPQAQWVGLRFVDERTHNRAVRNGKPEENSVFLDRGIMIEVLENGHFGYAATSDFTQQGLQKTFEHAKALAQAGSKHKVFHFDVSQRPASQGEYRTPVFRGLDSESLAELTDLLMAATHKLKVSPKIVTALASIRIVETKTHYVTSSGTNTFQDFLMLASNFSATAQEGS